MSVKQAPRHLPGTALHGVYKDTCNPSTWEVEAGGPEDPLHPHYSMSLSPAWTP